MSITAPPRSSTSTAPRVPAQLQVGPRIYPRSKAPGRSFQLRQQRAVCTLTAGKKTNPSGIMLTNALSLGMVAVGRPCDATVPRPPDDFMISVSRTFDIMRLAVAFAVRFTTRRFPVDLDLGRPLYCCFVTVLRLDPVRNGICMF